MATKISQIVGTPFSKKVQEEFERRRGLEQSFDNTSELYQPFFKIHRLKSLDPVTAMREPEEQDYLKGRFSKLGKVYSDDPDEYNFAYGLDDLERESEVKGFPAIQSVSFELEDFTFYRTTVNFEIPDKSYFKQFKDVWLQFGAPVQMEWGRYSPVGFEVDENEDILPNYESRLGNIVKFDYSSSDQSKTITGTIVIYSVTWLPVLQEGGSEDFEAEEFIDYTIQNLLNAVKNPLVFLGLVDEKDVEEFVERVTTVDESGGSQKSSDAITMDNGEKKPLEVLRSYFWGVRKMDTTKAESAQSVYTPYGLGIGKRQWKDEKAIDFFSLLPMKKIKPDYSNINTIEEFVNCHFKLNPNVYGTENYYFISFRVIEKILNLYYNRLTSRKLSGASENQSIFSFDLTNAIINNYSFRGIRSKKPDEILINPRNKRYNFDDDGNLIENTEGEYFVSGDIYISAKLFLDLLQRSRGGYSLVDSILKRVTDVTGMMVNLDQKRENGIISKGNVITTGISLIDSSTITDSGLEYLTFKLHHPREKILNHSFATEIADEISNMIFFRSRGEFLSEEDSKDINDIFLFSKQMNLRYFKEIFSDKLNNMTEEVTRWEKIVGQRAFRDNKKEYIEKYSNFEDFPLVHFDEESLEWKIKGLNNKNYNLDEYYKIRDRLVRKFENRYDRYNNDIAKNIADNINYDVLYGNVNKDKIINILTFLYLFFAQTVELFKVDNYSQNNFRMPYTLSLDFDGISGIIPSQAFKVNLESFPVDYTEEEDALFVVTGLSHTFEGNSWSTTINGSFWLDFKKNTFLNSYNENGISDLLTTEYKNTLATLRFIFMKKIIGDLEKYDNVVKLLDEDDYRDFIDNPMALEKLLNIQ